MLSRAKNYSAVELSLHASPDNLTSGSVFQCRRGRDISCEETSHLMIICLFRQRDEHSKNSISTHEHETQTITANKKLNYRRETAHQLCMSV